MLLTTLYGFFSKKSEIAKQRLFSKYSKVVVYFKSPKIKLNKKFTSPTINARLTDSKIMRKYTYLRVEID